MQLALQIVLVVACEYSRLSFGVPRKSFCDLQQWKFNADDKKMVKNFVRNAEWST